MNFSFDRLPVDLIFFALVAVFLVLRLRSVLGRRTGIQPAPVPPALRTDVKNTPAGPAPAPEPVVPRVAYQIPADNTRVGQLLGNVRQYDSEFTPQQFLTGAQAVFAQVVEAYATGNRDVLQLRLTPGAYASFDKAITARDAASEKQTTLIKAIFSMGIEDVRLNNQDGGTLASIDVRIISDQVSMITGADALPVAGTDAVTEFSDLWTFERLLGSPGSTWRLAAARSA